MVNFQSTYRNIKNGHLYKTVGYAHDPEMTNRIIIYVPIDLDNRNPYYRNELDFLAEFEYVGM